MKEVLREHYNILDAEVVEQQGGWAARAFKVSTSEKVYFLKMYEKSRASTIKWTARIDDYTSLLFKLCEGALKDAVPQPVLTIDGAYKCEDDKAIYLMYTYIEGWTIAEQSLTREQVVALGRIMGKLHSTEIDMNEIPEAIKEDFNIDFNSYLTEFLKREWADDISQAIGAYREQLKKLVEDTQELVQCVKGMDVNYVLCHTDVHNWNLMQSGEQLVLIDWEGLRLAPKEADFFSLKELPYYEDFLGGYSEYNRKLVIDPVIDRFYSKRRKSEDIWEYIEQLEYETLDLEKRKDVILSLIEECKEIEH